LNRNKLLFNEHFPGRLENQSELGALLKADWKKCRVRGLL